MSGGALPPGISRWWWLAHALVSPLSGVAVYALYRRSNPGGAYTHLLVSAVVGSLVILAGLTIGAEVHRST